MRVRVKARDVSLVASVVSLAVAACGSGPTDGPRTPDTKLKVGGIVGKSPSAPSFSEPLVPLSARPSNEQTADASEVAIAKRRAGEESAPADAPVVDEGPDPLNGAFSLAQATAGLEGDVAARPQLVATLKTSRGELRCRLFDTKAPVTVANFVGLARGKRPFKDKGRWVSRNAYDGTTFHRVIKGFMIQGGDPQGTGRGEPGYVIRDELWTGPESKHDRPGLLCMANRGPDTNGMQFFITDASAPHLDRSYTIFGECSPVSVVHAIANVPVDAGDRPEQDVTLASVTIQRAAIAIAPAAAAAPSAASSTPAASSPKP